MFALNWKNQGCSSKVDEHGSEVSATSMWHLLGVTLAHINSFLASAANSSRLTLKERAAIRQEEKAQSSSPKVGGGYRSESPPPPAYASDHGQSLASTPYQGEAKQSSSNTNGTYSPPAGHSKSPSGHSYVTALYDYAAQAEGDLSFSKGDRIELLQKTDDVNDWWTGRYNGITGVFPGMHPIFLALLSFLCFIFF